MPERFERLYQLPANLYVDNSPIIIVAGALLKDTVSGNVVVQVKYQNVSTQSIKALKIDVKAMDVSGQLLQGVVNYQYLDLDIPYGAKFGSNKAIVMPATVTRSFSINRITVIFSNGNIWESSSEMSSLPEAVLLQTIWNNEELLKQYRLVTKADVKFLPLEAMGLWRCTCGEWNSSSKCHRCNGEKASVFLASNTEYLIQEMESRLIAEQEQRKEQAILLEKARQEQAEKEKIAAEERIVQHHLQIKKTVHIAKFVIPVLAVLLLFSFWLYPSFISPKINEYRFNNAINILEESASYSEDEVLDALSLVMMTGLNKRLALSNTPVEEQDLSHFKSLISAEEHLLNIGELSIDNLTISQSFSSYVEGLSLQKTSVDNFIESSPREYPSNLDANWVYGLHLRSSSIIVLQNEGILTLPPDTYGEFCKAHIEAKLIDEMKLISSADHYDEDHYSITFSIYNDTHASFDHFELQTKWNDEYITVATENWASGDTWDAVFIITSDTISSGDIDVAFDAYYEGITMDNSN